MQCLHVASAPACPINLVEAADPARVLRGLSLNCGTCELCEAASGVCLDHRIEVDMNRKNGGAHARVAPAGARRVLALLTVCSSLIAFCGTAHAISYVQDKYHSTSAPAVAVSVNFPSAQSAGDLVVVAIAWLDRHRACRCSTTHGT